MMQNNQESQIKTEFICACFTGGMSTDQEISPDYALEIAVSTAHDDVTKYLEKYGKDIVHILSINTSLASQGNHYGCVITLMVEMRVTDE